MNNRSSHRQHPQDPPQDQDGSTMPSNSTFIRPDPPAQSKRKKQKNDSTHENSILLKLLEGCAKHKRRHETGEYDAERKDDDNEDIDGRENSSGKTLHGNKKCTDELRSLARVLPRVETCIDVKDTKLDEYHFESCDNVKGEGNDGNDQNENRHDEGERNDDSNPLESRMEEDDVRHICALYRAIARGAFCPLAASYLFGGDANSSSNGDKEGSNVEEDLEPKNAEMLKGIMPKILQLLRYLVMDPERVAFLFAEQLPEQNRVSGSFTSIREAVSSYLHNEDVGATISALLNLVDDDELRSSAANDLVTLLQDLHTVEESGVLFDPSMKYDLGNSNQTHREWKIKIYAFPRIFDYLRKEFNNRNDFVFDGIIGISSRRSLLALKLGIWTALYHFIPILFTDLSRLASHDDNDNLPGMEFVTYARSKDRDMRRNLLLSVISCSRTSLLSTPELPHLQADHIPLWRYSICDVNIHSLLALQTKLVIVGLFVQKLTSTAYESCDIGGLPWEDFEAELSVLSVESAQSHLCYQTFMSTSDLSGVRKQTMQKHLITWCTWVISEFVACAVLFPGDSTQARRDIWSFSLPHLMDCIPFISYSNRSTDDEKVLGRVLLRAMHAIILQGSNNDTLEYSVATRNQPTIPMIDLFLRRCLAYGYLPHLFGLIKDSSDSICSPAISIIVYLLEQFERPNVSKQTFTIDLIDKACNLSLNHFKASQDHLDRDNEIETSWDSISRGYKRTKLNDDATSLNANRGPDYKRFDRERLTNSTASSLMSSLTHAIGNGLAQSQLIMMKIDSADKANSQNKTIPIMTSQDLFALRDVTGTLRILLHFLPADQDDIPNNSIEIVVTMLFKTVACVSEVLTNQRSVKGDFCHLDQVCQEIAAETIVKVGLQACQAKRRKIDGRFRNVIPREAISHFALAILPFISSNDSSRSNDTIVSTTLSDSIDRSCKKLCSRLCSSIGTAPKLKNGVCLCRLSCTSNKRLSSECGDMTLDETLPLSCRCILLATVFPVASDSTKYDPTISSVRGILQNAPRAQDSLIAATSLFGLTNLFISLAVRKNGCSRSSAKYIERQIDSFCIKDVIIQHASSRYKTNCYAAFFSLAKLAVLSKTVLIILSEESTVASNNQDRVLSTFLWEELNPIVHDTCFLVLRFIRLDEHIFSHPLGHNELHRDITIHLNSNEFGNIPTNCDGNPSIQLAKLVYLQSIVALAPTEALKSRNLSTFFTGEGRKMIYEAMRYELNSRDGNDHTATALIPPPIWILIMPFIAQEAPIQQLASKFFAPALLGNNGKLLSLLFSGQENVIAPLFREIDHLLSAFCDVDRRCLISNIAGKSNEASDKFPTNPRSNASFALGVFNSLCQHTPSETISEIEIFKRSLLSLLRIWIGYSGGKVRVVDGDFNRSLSFASTAYDNICEIFKNTKQSCYSKSPRYPLDCIRPMLPMIFSEFFLPPVQELHSPRTRYLLLTEFIDAFLLPSSSFPRSPSHNTVEVLNVIEIIGFVDQMLPIIISKYIEDEDYEALQMCTAFRIFLVSEAKRLNKEEKKAQKRNIDEVVVGVKYGKYHSLSPSRSLVPGMSISTKKLIENIKLLCVKSDVIECVLPRLLLHPNRGPLKFFTAKICLLEVNLSEILQQKELTVLKSLVWELGGDDLEHDKKEEVYDDSANFSNFTRNAVLLALAKGVLLKSDSGSTTASKHDSIDSTSGLPSIKSAESWVAPNFMYLLVNIVLYKWHTKSNRERFQSIKCLKEMLRFLPSQDSPRYMPQIMSAVNNAMTSPSSPSDLFDSDYFSKLCLVAVTALFDFIKIVTSHDSAEVGENLVSIVVTLYPLFDTTEDSPFCSERFAKEKAAEMLEWLASGKGSDKLPPYFNEIPFLPSARELQPVRIILEKKGVSLDDMKLLRKENYFEKNESDDVLQAKFYARMNILSDLIASHESKSVRKVVLEHMTDLIKANRSFFQNLVENEELASMHFLTVVRDPFSSDRDDGGDKSVGSSSYTASVVAQEFCVNGGFVTNLLRRLLSRCVDESDRDLKDALASCLGEIGAIDPNRLGREISSCQFESELQGSNDNDWRLSHPPWKGHVDRYQLRLLSRHLVTSLKSSPTILDQHKISFGIQELLKLLNEYGSSNHLRTDGGAKKERADEPTKSSMSQWLREKLEEADVLNVVEPFWTTNYKQADTAAAKSPPFFLKSSSYYVWLSSFSRFLISRSISNKNSIWRRFFYACRSAIRSNAGISAAEFLFPLLILDAMCFGNSHDERIVVRELVSTLSFEPVDSEAICSMNLREREKAANAVFTLIDLLRKWVDQEIEDRFRESRRRKRAANVDLESCTSAWPADTVLSKIRRLLDQIPLSLCASAASRVGMNARALQFLEIDSRSQIASSSISNTKKNTASYHDSKFLKSCHIDGIDLQLTKKLLGQLCDFDTMITISQKNNPSELSSRLLEVATEREMYGDWEGALQAYEHLLDSRLRSDNNEGLGRYVGCSKDRAQKGLLRCLLKLGRLDSVLNQAYGMSKQDLDLKETEFSNEILPYATEAAWRLGKWSSLDSLVNEGHDESGQDANAKYQLSLGRTMHSIHCRLPEKVILGLRDARECVMSSLSSAARDSYSRSYPYLMQLHLLREVEYISSVIFSEKDRKGTFVEFVSSDEWKDRIKMITPDITGSNDIINTRLALSRMANEPALEGSLWLEIGRLARKGGLYQVAEHSLAQADMSFQKAYTEPAPVDDSFIFFVQESIGNVKLQLAKLKHAVGETTTALNLIENNIPASIFQMNDAELDSYVSKMTRDENIALESKETLSRRILQSTEWLVSGGLRSGSEIKSRYHTVLKLAPKWERAHFHFGKYIESLLETRFSALSELGNNASRLIVLQNDKSCQEYSLESVSHFGKSLQLGQKHVFQALPRLLAIWLEFTSIESADKNASLEDNQAQMNSLIKGFAEKIPEHLFYTALPQLLSCVIHQNDETAKNVALILTSVLAKYPGQAMWSCGWLRYSKSKEKNGVGEKIFVGAQSILQKQGNDLMRGMLDASKHLFNFLITLARFNAKENHTSVRMKVPIFEPELKHFIPPIQAALSVTPGALSRSSSCDVFPPFVPRMRTFNPELKIMQSKAKPRKLSAFVVPSTVAQRETSLPSNGVPVSQDSGEMHFLVKQEAKGDLRKDSRVQDLNNVINRLFVGRKASSGPNSRRQRMRLQLRTFSVVCLTEDCGILEWVPNTESFRSLVGGTYNPQVPSDSIHRRGTRLSNFNDANLRNAFQRCQELFFVKKNLKLAAKKFNECVLQQYLPVMYWWFIQNFSNPHAWFEARTNFTLSAAVWSAVGHVIGLGDRHSENILIDTRSGECVHVDFDCIFDKGLYLPKPEVIPFRLTPNMLDSFGPCGADGLYTGALTESMKTLRKNRDILLSVLEPFLKDPVINFSSSKSQQKSSEDKDIKSAKRSIGIIDGRLKGVYNLRNPNYKKIKREDVEPSEEGDISHITQLSVEGQVQKMIMEATSHENLVQVYVGWMPWI